MSIKDREDFSSTTTTSSSTSYLSSSFSPSSTFLLPPAPTLSIPTPVTASPSFSSLSPGSVPSPAPPSPAPPSPTLSPSPASFHAAFPTTNPNFAAEAKAVGIELPQILTLCAYPEMTIGHDGEEIVGYTLTSLLPAEMTTFNSRMRRFNDFVRLYHSLCQAHPDVAVPSLPSAHDVVGWFQNNRFQPEFIEQRRQDLNTWINEVLRTAPLVEDPELLVFLCLPGITRRREVKPAPPSHLPYDENYLYI